MPTPTDIRIDWEQLRLEYARQSAALDGQLLKIKIDDDNEPLVYVPNVIKRAEIIFAEDSSLYLRSPVAEALAAAAEEFNRRGFTLVLKSAYRSLAKQEQLFEARYRSIKTQYPTLTQAEAFDRANTYTAGIPALAAHTGGAAVDVILNDSSGQGLDFGAPYSHGDIESITDFPQLGKTASLNRQLLKEVMKAAGFTNYPFEYWHFSLGDVCAAYLKNQGSAAYGPVYFDPESQQQSILEPELAYKPFLGGE